MAAAHASGVPHLCLTPQSLRWTPGGGVKVLGVGIDAALSDTTADDPALADTRGLAMLLYAALTRYWPGPGMGTLPPAPLADGRPCSPRQVCAGVPASIDEVASQALFQRDRRRGPPLTTPALFAEALEEVIPAPLAPPPAAPAPPTRAGNFSRPGEYGGSAPYGGEPPSDYPGTAGWTPGGGGGGRGFTPPRRSDGRPLLTRLAIVLVILLVLAAIGTGVYSLTRHHGSPSANPGRSGGNSASPSTAAKTVLTPVGAQGYDALGLASDPGNEDNAGAKFAIDGSPSTAWHTQFYLGNPVLGGLKKGTGLLLDMGKQVSLSSVQVTFGPTAGANVAIEVGNSNAISPTGLASFTKVAKRKHLDGGTQTFQTSSTAKGRYVLIWFTKLPPNNAGQFQAFVYNVVVRGSG
jgi:hypothetical protein